jgi:hypothetical protein
MTNAKNIDIKKLTITKQEFKSALEKVSQRVGKTEKVKKNG